MKAFSTSCLAALAAASLAMPTMSEAQTVIALTADQANSTPVEDTLGDIQDLNNLLNDPFAYSVVDPGSASPDLAFSDTTGWHGDVPSAGDAILSFDGLVHRS